MIIQRLPRQCSVPSRGCECSQRTIAIAHWFQTSKITCSHILLFHTYNYRMQRITHAKLPSRTIHDIGTTVKELEGRREKHSPKSISIKKPGSTEIVQKREVIHLSRGIELDTPRSTTHQARCTRTSEVTLGHWCDRGRRAITV
jgi:hypothetical protein